jgi:catalase-peroxidase
MTRRTLFARVVASGTVLCLAASVFAQNRPIPAKDSGQAPGGKNMENVSQCPVIGGTLKDPSNRNTAAGAMANRNWWPNQLNLQILHQNSPMGNPLGEDFDYAEEFKKSIWMP